MPTSQVVIEQFASVSGLKPATLERMVRVLLAAGLVPMGEKGRGRSVGHYDARHLANLIASFAGPQTVDAAEAATLLCGLPFFQTFYPLESRARAPLEQGRAPFPGATFGETLEHLIRDDADLIENALQGEKPDFADEHWTLPHDIQLSLKPLMVKIHWQAEGFDNGEISRIDNYLCYRQADQPELPPALRSPGGVRRTTHIPREVIFTAARLLRESPAWRPTSKLSPPAPVVATAGQTDGNAGSLARDPAPASDRAASPQNPGDRTHPEDARGREKSQPRRRRGPVTPPQLVE